MLLSLSTIHIAVPFYAIGYNLYKYKAQIEPKYEMLLGLAPSASQGTHAKIFKLFISNQNYFRFYKLIC
jgi:hypothetical protein